MKEIFSHGGGTQSAAITALIVMGKLPKPDFVCIVDTERERSTTWEYLDAVIRPALASVGLDVHRIRKSEWGTKPEHGIDWLSHNGSTVLLPAFTDLSGEPGKLSGYCSKTWKAETQQRYVRKALGIPTRDQKSWIGFSLDEASRAIRMMQGDEFKAGRIRLPLIHDIPTRRQQAIRIVETIGWPAPPRSACWMCPNQRDDEWRDLKSNHPDEFKAACELEVEVRLKDPDIWLHRSCKPLGEVDFSEEPNLFGDTGCESGVCML